MAQDIAMTLVDHFGDVEILLARTVSDALARLEPVDRLLVAIADLSPDDFASNPLAGAVASADGRVVLIADVVEGETETVRDWTVLDRPFRSETLVAALPPIRPA